MLRIHFTVNDVVNTRFTTTYGPLSEALFGLALLGEPPRSLFADWQRRLLHGSGHWNRPLLVVADLCCPVDLLTLTGQAPTLTDGLAALTATRNEDLRAEIEAGLARRFGAPGSVGAAWAPWLLRAPDDRAVRKELLTVLSDVAAVLVTPRWERLRRHLSREVAARSRQMAEDGLGKVLTTLHPHLRWRPPVLEVWTGDEDVTDLHLDGRGLELVPSIFCRRQPPPYVSLRDPAAAPVLFYRAPVSMVDLVHMLSPAEPPDDPSGLDDVLGRSRAAVLRVTASGGCSTSDIARRTGLSLAGASQHAKALRNARLVMSRRIGGSVHHTATQLGQLLLDGGTA